MSYCKSYKDLVDSKGLYVLFDPKTVQCRRKVIEVWYSTIAKNAYEIVGPVLVPKPVLERSGHIDTFKDELYKIEGRDLYLRPETAQSIFSNLKVITRGLKGNPLQLSQIGKSFRDEKSTRGGMYRRNQFEQMELEALADTNYPFIQHKMPHILEFFKLVGLEVEFKEIGVDQRPHYSKNTVDILTSDGIEVGCINYRGSHDLYDYTTQNTNKEIYEISLGLDRIVEKMMDQ